MEATLRTLGFSLEEEQPHISGERFLMAKNKQVLMARRDKDNLKVIIKVADNIEGKKDVTKERSARKLLMSVAFAEETIDFPEEIYWGEENGYLVWAMEFIEQEKVFVAHSLEEQFFLILKAFESQEAFHATTYEHIKEVREIFPIFRAKNYLAEFKSFAQAIGESFPIAEKFLSDNKELIDKYCDYLAHTDFVPHNFRIRGRAIYMLDCAPEERTVHFGNKYEGWARFCNYMVIHNPELNQLIFQYIRDNRGEEEFLNLRLMRVYKTGFILKFYADSLANTQGDLKELTLERINFWHRILKNILEDKELSVEEINQYRSKRDNLRSEEEKKRQREFAVA